MCNIPARPDHARQVTCTRPGFDWTGASRAGFRTPVQRMTNGQSSGTLAYSSHAKQDPKDRHFLMLTKVSVVRQRVTKRDSFATVCTSEIDGLASDRCSLMPAADDGNDEPPSTFVP